MDSGRRVKSDPSAYAADRESRYRDARRGRAALRATGTPHAVEPRTKSSRKPRRRALIGVEPFPYDKSPSNMLNSSVLVLNRSYLPVHVTTARRAFSLIFRAPRWP